MLLSLQFEDNGTGHGDVVLCLGDVRWTCDSYYLALDRACLPEREDADKVRVVLGRLLQQWSLALRGLVDQGAVFLPYDFSDQYTGWLACHRFGDGAVVSQGWATMWGHSLTPSRLGDLRVCPEGFRESGTLVRTPLGDLVSAVKDLASAALAVGIDSALTLRS